ncbi:MAG: hypothetical protein ACOYBO_01035 [Azonexus sp.]
MPKRNVLLAMLFALLLLSLTLGATFAAPEKTDTSFGLLMKPGWVGGNDATNQTRILILRCALRNSGRGGVDSEKVVTGNLGCATFPMARMINHRDYIGNRSWPTVTFTFSGTTDLFLARPR